MRLRFTGAVVASLIFRHGAAAAAFNVAVAVLVGVRAGDDPAFVLVACISAAIVAAEEFGRNGPLQWPGRLVWSVVAGVTLMTVGIGLRAWSIATLGLFF